ncbi:MAG: hypothetical protein LBH16_00960 [Treponema sp.]|jgi:hypothetical protein|nr:hypothetical protein [Treponema sp.]
MKVQGKSMIGVIPGTDFTETFGDYYKPLNSLEDAFQSSGLPIEFDLKVSPYSNQLFVTVMYKGGAVINVSIAGDSPAQAVKDVSDAVHL